MNFLRYIIFFSIGLLVSCANNKITHTSDAVAIPTTKISDHSVGNWKNIYLGNPLLAGVEVQQFPDSSLKSVAYEGKHPAMILFVMWDGKVNQIGYEPSGKISENFWWNLNKGDRDNSSIWDQLDYSHGSDPSFQRHPDPRVKKNG